MKPETCLRIGRAGLLQMLRAHRLLHSGKLADVCLCFGHSAFGLGQVGLGLVVAQAHEHLA